jgi:hypothetical protein
VPLVRATCQGPETIETFYRELAASQDRITSAIGAGMLRLLPGLVDTCATHKVWGLTSHFDLWLLAADDYTSRWLVFVIAHPAGSYEVRYAMTEADQPWPDALVAGSTMEPGEALSMIRVAMRRCGAWR